MRPFKRKDLNTLPDIEIEIPIKVISEANQSEHWTDKHKRHRGQKTAVNYFISGPIRKELIYLGLPLLVKLTRVAPRKLDSDNLISAFKHIRDYIAAIIIPGKQIGRSDDTDQIKWEYDQEKGEPKEYNILIQIWKV